MIRHIVFWDLKECPEAAAHAAEIKAASPMLESIPGVLSVEVSIEPEPTTTVCAKVVLQSAHETPEDLAAYAVHPTHLEFAKLIKAYCEKRQALDYRI